MFNARCVQLTASVERIFQMLQMWIAIESKMVLTELKCGRDTPNLLLVVVEHQRQGHTQFKIRWSFVCVSFFGVDVGAYVWPNEIYSFIRKFCFRASNLIKCKYILMMSKWITLRCKAFTSDSTFGRRVSSPKRTVIIFKLPSGRENALQAHEMWPVLFGFESHAKV